MGVLLSPGWRGQEPLRSAAVVAFAGAKLKLAVSLIMLSALLASTDASLVGSSLYDELGVSYNVTSDEIFAAYERHAQAWSTDRPYEPHEIRKIIEIEHAYHVLSNNLTRRDYDYFQIDQLEADVAEVRKEYEGKAGAQYVQFPLWRPGKLGGSIHSTAETVTSANFGHLVLHSQQMWVIQIYSIVSSESHEFAPVWDKTVDLLDGVVKVGRLELGQVPLTILIAERHWLRGYPFFRNGLPAIIAVHPGCEKLGCIIRYYGEKTSEDIADWVATRILKLPRILYHSGASLIPQFLRKHGNHKVKVVQFSTTGERASLQLRKCSKDYWEYVAFAMVLWRENEADFWEKRFGVQHGPATVFFKDPGLPPVIHHGKLTSSDFVQLLDQHKTFELPQLRTITAASLGCDPSHPSLAGNETKIWYCVIVAGRHSISLNKMRRVMRDVQSEMISAAHGETLVRPSVQVYKDKRLSFAWLDGEMQKAYCYFYLHSETVFEACGPRKPEYDDIAKIFLVRYYKEDPLEPRKGRWLPKTHLEAEAEEQRRHAAQLVTRYSGSADSDEIINWISSMVTQGDKDQLAGFRGKAPDLVTEERIGFSTKTQEYVFDKREGLLDKWRGVRRALEDLRDDAKFLPLLFFIVAVYSAACYLRKNRKTEEREQALASENSNDETAHRRLNSTPATDVNVQEQDSTGSSSVVTEGLRRRQPLKNS